MTAPLKVPCPRYRKTRETNAYDTEWHTYPSSVSSRERDTTMTKDVYDSYEACPGEVPVLSEGRFGACDDCHCADWTTHEIASLTASLEGSPYVE